MVMFDVHVDDVWISRYLQTRLFMFSELFKASKSLFELNIPDQFT